MDRWRRIAARRVERCGIFDLERVRFEPDRGGPAREFWVIDAPDWINVIPLTADRRVVMVRQFRFGIAAPTLEIPGGMCDPGETAEQAARRELREETGYEAARLEELGWVHPNPPLQGNRCHTFLARGLDRRGEPDPDPHESLEQVQIPWDEVARRIARGEITHALVLAAFHLASVRGIG